MSSVPSAVPAIDLFDRLAAGTEHTPQHAAEPTDLRPLLPFHVAIVPLPVAMETEPPAIDVTAWRGPDPFVRPPSGRDRRVPQAADASRSTTHRVEPPAAPLPSVASVRPAGERSPIDKPPVAPLPSAPRIAGHLPAPQSARLLEPDKAEQPAPAATRPHPRRTPPLPLEPVRPDNHAPSRHEPPPTPIFGPPALAAPSGKAGASGLRSRNAASVEPLPLPVRKPAEPTIEIHIGRIDVLARIVAATPSLPSARPTPPPVSALAAHLAARGRGARS
jgi:hypothetical protein